MTAWTLVEANKISIVEQSLKGILSVKLASEQLELSSRQIYRLRKRLRSGGASSIRHGNLGKRPINAAPKSTRRKALSVFNDWRRRCDGAPNAAHLRDILERDHGIVLSRQTLWRWLKEEGAIGDLRRRKPHRLRRERETREGSMLFLDGSPHRWFGPTKRKSTLILCSDDATGKALFGLFADAEDRDSCFAVAYEVFTRLGLPSKFYLDRASQFVTTRAGKTQAPPPTEWQRAMRELGVACIFATSPQARGRGERLNGTFQARLCHELAYRGIDSIRSATQFLNQHFIPEHNRRCSVPAADSTVAWRKPANIDLRTVLCAKTSRHVSLDNTVLHSNLRFQITPHPSRICLAGLKVEAQDWFDGSIRFYHPRAGLLTSVGISRIKRTKSLQP